jgi:hypothetical protein
VRGNADDQACGWLSDFYVSKPLREKQYMRETGGTKSLSLGGVAMIATAIGAVAVGAFAIGALAIGRLAVRRLSIEYAQLKSLEIENLTVRRLNAVDVVVSDSLTLPASKADFRAL